MRQTPRSSCRASVTWDEQRTGMTMLGRLSRFLPAQRDELRFLVAFSGARFHSVQGRAPGRIEKERLLTCLSRFLQLSSCVAFSSDRDSVRQSHETEGSEDKTGRPIGPSGAGQPRATSQDRLTKFVRMV